MRSIIIFTTNSEHFSMRPQAGQLIKAGGKKLGPLAWTFQEKAAYMGPPGFEPGTTSAPGWHPTKLDYGPSRLCVRRTLNIIFTRYSENRASHSTSRVYETSFLR